MTKRRLITAILSVIIITVSVCVSITATNIPPQPDNLYVYDNADVLSDESEKHIIGQNKKLSYSTGAEIMIATVNDIGEYSLRDFASMLFNEWEVGDPQKNNGVLILLVIGTDNFYIVQGSGIEDKITSDDIVSLRDNYLEPAFAKKDYDKGTVTLFDKLIVKYEDIYDVKLEDVSVPSGALEAKWDGKVITSILISLVVIIGIVGFIFVVVVIYNKIADSRYSRGGRRPTITLKPRAARPAMANSAYARSAATHNGARPNPAMRANAAPRPNPGARRPAPQKGTPPRGVAPSNAPRPNMQRRPGNMPQGRASQNGRVPQGTNNRPR